MPSYILSNFPMVHRQDEARIDDWYRTKEMILAYMNALAAKTSRPTYWC